MSCLYLAFKAVLYVLLSNPRLVHLWNNPTNFILMTIISKYLSGPAVSNPATKNSRERRNIDLPVLDVHAVAREEGEGMETTDTESVSSAGTYIPSLEQLLNSPETKPGRLNAWFLEAFACVSCRNLHPQNTQKYFVLRLIGAIHKSN